MKKLLLAVLLLTLASTGVFAVAVGSIDTECQGLGFDYGVAKWECDDLACTGAWTLNEEVYTGTSVTGDCDSADWDVGTSGADGIVVKADGDAGTHEAIIGTSGTITKDKYAFSHVTFCGYDEEVPEFSTIAAAVALVGAIAGFVFLRKKN